MKCMYCGNENLENAAFCTKCGRKTAKGIASNNWNSETSQESLAAQYAPKQPNTSHHNNQQPPFPPQQPNYQQQQPPYAQQPYAPQNPYAPQQPIMQYADLGTRFLAHLVDGLIIGAVTTFLLVGLGIIVAIAASGSNSLASSNGEPPAIIIFIMLLFYPLLFAFILGYLSYFESSRHQGTLGKKLLKIKVVNADGQRISFKNALGRNAFKICISGFCMIGYILAFFSDTKQALHDTVASTYVVTAASSHQIPPFFDPKNSVVARNLS